MKIFYIIFISCLYLLTQSKYASRTFTKNDLQTTQKSIFLTKFDFGSQGGSIKIKAKTRNIPREQQIYILVDVIVDDKLQAYLQSNYSLRNQHVLRTQQMTFQRNSQVDQRKFIIPQQDHQHIHYIYFVNSNLNPQQATTQEKKQNILKQENQQLYFQITLLNGESHFGQDQKMLIGYFVLVGVWIGMMVKFAAPIGKSIFTSKDKTQITVFTGLIILGVAYFYRLIHFGIYYSNGKGLHFFEVLYIALKSGCQFIIVTILVAIGWGWSITHLRHDQSYILAGVTATIINIVGLIISASAQQMVDTHHKYDSTSGYILQILRFIIVIIFVIGIIRSLNLSVGNIRKFVKKLGIIGGIYLISWPATVLFAQLMLPNYMHNQVITFVQQITHIVATLLLCQMLAHPQSTYRKVSIKQQDNPLKMQNYKRK